MKINTTITVNRCRISIDKGSKFVYDKIYKIIFLDNITTDLQEKNDA